MTTGLPPCWSDQSIASPGDATLVAFEVMVAGLAAWSVVLTSFDCVARDAVGAIFLAEDRSLAIVLAPEPIRTAECEHAPKMHSSTSFREQARLDEYIALRRAAERNTESLRVSTDLNVSELIR